MLSNEVIEKIVSRHIGRAMQRMDEVNSPRIVKDCVKSEMWLISDDIKLKLEQTGDENEGQKKDEKYANFNR